MRRYALEYYVGGHLGSFRIVKGQSIYNSASSTITVPTAPFTSTPNTVFLMNFTDAAIEDFTGKVNLETLGDAKANNIITKFSTGSFSGDGTGDYLNIPNSSLHDLGSGDFTIEMWLYFSGSTGSFYNICGKWSSSTQWILQWRGTFWRFYTNNGGAPSVDWNDSVSSGQWYHIAVCRSGSNFRFFRDGTQIGSTYTSSAAITSTTDILQIGGAQGSTTPLNGNISDFRLSKVARYTTNFTPPTRSFPTR